MADQRFFRNTGPYLLSDLAVVCQAEYHNPKEDLMIHDIRPLSVATSKDLVGCHNTKYLKELPQTQALACIIHPDHVSLAPPHMALLVTPKPYRAYAQLLGHFYPEEKPIPSVASTAIIAQTAKIGQNVTIGGYAVIGDHVEIGEGCYVGPHTIIENGVILGEQCHIGPHVSLSHAVLGKRVTIKTGARIGQRGFGFDMDEQGHVNVPQLGGVVIGDDVLIGSNTTVDRGSNENTQIGRGCRIDNLVQIGHNVVLGDHCVIVAQVGISGSSTLGRFVAVGGQGGIAGHLTIGDGARVAAKSGLMRDVPAGETVAGIPAVPAREHFRQVALLSQMAKKKG